MINLTDSPDFVIGSPKESLFMKLKKKYQLSARSEMKARNLIQEMSASVPAAPSRHFRL
jgi:hypothetical protein